MNRIILTTASAVFILAVIAFQTFLHGNILNQNTKTPIAYATATQSPVLKINPKTAIPSKAKSIQNKNTATIAEPIIRQTTEPTRTPSITPIILIPSPIVTLAIITPTPYPSPTLTPSIVVTSTPRITPTTTPTSTPTPTTTPTPSPAPATQHTFYTSSHWKAKYYYCDTDKDWQTLSKDYLKTFGSEAELLQAYPNHILHEPCK